MDQPSRHKEPWTAADDNALRAAVARKEPDVTIGLALGRIRAAIKDRRHVMNLCAWSLRRPSKTLWTEIATREANKAGINPVAVMAGDRHRPFILARWRAWRVTLGMGYSLNSIGQVSGFHHATVMHGLARLGAE